MVWVKNCLDDDWINLDNVFSISFQQMDTTGKDDWIEVFVRPSGARILQISLEIGPNPNRSDDDISWHSLFYDRAMEVTNAIFEAISKAQRENKVWIDLQKEISIKFNKPSKR
jgi:hypothetical protein